jgi:hypothetical protein
MSRIDIQFAARVARGCAARFEGAPTPSPNERGVLQIAGLSRASATGRAGRQTPDGYQKRPLPSREATFSPH